MSHSFLKIHRYLMILLSFVILCGSVFSLVSVITTGDVWSTLAKHLASGQIAFWIAGLLCGFWVLWQAVCRRVHALSWVQWTIFLYALCVMFLGYRTSTISFGKELVDPILTFSLPVLAWATFFILDDWILIEQLVVRGKESLRTSHIIRFTIFNWIILFSANACVLELWDTQLRKVAEAPPSPAIRLPPEQMEKVETQVQEYVLSPSRQETSFWFNSRTIIGLLEVAQVSRTQQSLRTEGAFEAGW